MQNHSLNPDLMKPTIEHQYIDLLKHIHSYGDHKGQTRGQGTTYRFSPQIRGQLSRGVPVLTTKEMSFKNLIGELLWLISGEASIQPMLDEGINFWKPWADDDGHVESYGGFWRQMPLTQHVAPIDEFYHIGEEQDNRKSLPVESISGKPFVGLPSMGVDLKPGQETQNEYVNWSDDLRMWVVDQFAWLLHRLEHSPFSRRHKLDYWVPQNALASSLPPCPMHIVFNVFEDQPGVYELSASLFQRSADMPVGVPYNIAVTGLLVKLICFEMNRRERESTDDTAVTWQAGELAMTLVDAHIYDDQMPVVPEQLGRKVRPSPVLMHGLKDKPLLDMKVSDWESFELEGYDPHPAVNYNVQE